MKMSEWIQRIVESKRAKRRELAALPFAEKMKILERLRERTRLLRAARPVSK